MSDQIEQIAAYLGLLVQHAGGEVRISFDEVENLPGNSGVRVVMDEESEEIVFKIQANDAE